MAYAIAKTAMVRARTAFRRKNPKTLSAKRLDDLLLEIDLDAPTAGLTTDEKNAFWRGIARLAAGDADPQGGKLLAILRRYVGTKNDRWLLWAIGEIEDLPRARMEAAFGHGAGWRQEIPKLLAERLVNEEKWAKLLDNVNPRLRAELIYWRADNRVLRTRYNTFETTDPHRIGPTTPAPPTGATLSELGFDTGDARRAMAERGWRSAGLLGWGDAEAPVTRTLTSRFPSGDTPGAGLPRSAEGWVTLGHGQRSAAADALQKQVVADFLRDHPHFNTSWNTERQVQRVYRHDVQRYVDVDAPADIDFDSPDFDEYWTWPDWNGSHLGAHSFGFDTNAENVIPLPGRINKSYMAYYEEVIRDLYHRFDGKLYIRVQVEEYDAHGFAKVVRYEAFTPDANGTPIRVMNEGFVSNYNPTITRAEKSRQVEKAWREHQQFLDAEGAE